MTPETVRLHISPLTPALLPAVLGARLTGIATNVTYGEIQTFPEHNYGFVDLPTADAEQLKKKLSGAIFKGVKMKIDEARPKKRRRTDASPEVAEQAQPVSTESAAPSKKKRKSTNDNVVPGRELSPERKVRRAWTEPGKDKKSKKNDVATKQQPSKFTEKEELLFRTKVPSSKADLVSKKPKKPKKSKHGAEESVVHEFEKNIAQPSFLRTSTSGQTTGLTYEDGKGWVNSDGVVVEAEPASLTQKRDRISKKKRKEERSLRKAAKAAKVDGADLDDQMQNTGEQPRSPQTTQKTPDVEEDDAELIEEPDESTSEVAGKHQADAQLQSAAVEEPNRAKDCSHQSTNSPEVHPLESLFKKPRMPASQDVAKPSLEISTAFSFFDQDTDEDDTEPKMPLTPFTSQDLRNRGMRSAAPTPDTAYPSRFNSHDSIQSSEDEEEEPQEKQTELGAKKSKGDEGSSSPTKGNDATVSEFEKEFWEKRGDNNRAWKARRRAVLKEKRHRENRARRPKNW